MIDPQGGPPSDGGAPPVPPSPQGNPQAAIMQMIQKLQEMLKQGVISPQQFQAAMAKLQASMGGQPPQAPPQAPPSQGQVVSDPEQNMGPS